MAWPDVDLEFVDAAGQMTLRPGVPVHEPVNAHLDTGANADVSHTVDPVYFFGLRPRRTLGAAFSVVLWFMGVAGAGKADSLTRR